MRGLTPKERQLIIDTTKPCSIENACDDDDEAGMQELQERGLVVARPCGCSTCEEYEYSWFPTALGLQMLTWTQ